MSTAQDILNYSIERLEYNQGALFDVSNGLPPVQIDTWLDKGEWLQTAIKAGVEKIFFVENNPVVVFARCNDNENIAEVYNRIWCLSRPRLLFLVFKGELLVIDLTQEPRRKDDELRTLSKLKTIAEVERQLKDFHRSNVESGKLFEHKRFGGLGKRADQALIADLKSIRRSLLDAGLDYTYAHALIGRSIFIRYLEDRKILTEQYFSEITQNNLEWQRLLQHPTSRDNLDFSGVKAFYPRVLQNKDFTYALFQALGRDFNGDMFPDTDIEEQHVDQKHLNILQDLLYGDIGHQGKLFFFSYKFDIIPLDLISAIYEDFYHGFPEEGEDEKKSKARQDGAYYTPPVLAEFVCSKVLTAEVLAHKPRVLDPACGSGIFLVEAFRRIVRYSIITNNNKIPSFDELKNIIKEQIVGIEINIDAARITSFSLYLAMLHYLDPPSILEYIKQGKRLPNLLTSGEKSEDHFNNIHGGRNSFNIFNDEVGKVDVVIGNPPWGAPGNAASEKTKKRHNVLVEWCKNNNLPIGDQEPSQAFLWRAVDLLQSDGTCALFVSAGVLLKHSSTSREFREVWMDRVCITEVFNFTHVRKFFFNGGISPFILIHFNKGKQDNTPVEYWSAKRITNIEKTQSVLFSKYDRVFLVNQNLADNKIWKINWFGRNLDSSLFVALKQFPDLSTIIDDKHSGRGFQEGNKKFEATWLAEFEELPTSCFSRYEPLNGFTISPPRVESRGKCKELYQDKRILIRRGISTSLTSHNIVARFIEKKFCFRNSIHCIHLLPNIDEKVNVLLTGVLWSSFAKYFLFNTSSNWGIWHDEIHLEELFSFPLPLVLESATADNVISIVQKLRNYHPTAQDLTKLDGDPQEIIDEQRRNLEAELDDAVFDLYNFSEAERDLIRDCCEVTLPFFYQPHDSIGNEPVIDSSNDTTWMLNYAERFACCWQPYLNDDEVMRADLHVGASKNMVAIEFYPADKGDKWNLKPQKDSWAYILEEIGKFLQQPMGTSQIILDGVVFAVNPNNSSFIIIKRNEKRYWTRSIGREDAETTLAKAMRLEIDGEEQ